MFFGFLLATTLVAVFTFIWAQDFKPNSIRAGIVQFLRTCFSKSHPKLSATSFVVAAAFMFSFWEAGVWSLLGTPFGGWEVKLCGVLFFLLSLRAGGWISVGKKIFQMDRIWAVGFLWLAWALSLGSPLCLVIFGPWIFFRLKILISGGGFQKLG